MTATKTRKPKNDTTTITECNKCGHVLKMMKFKGEKKALPTCPDCGWRVGKITQALQQIAADEQKAPKTPKVKATFTGEILATKLYRKALPNKNCEAIAYAAVQEPTQTVQYVNSYNGALTAGYRPEVYTFPIKAKAIKKLETEWIECEGHEWPGFITHTSVVKSPAKTRRAAK